jgi:hypothetical protein
MSCCSLLRPMLEFIRARRELDGIPQNGGLLNAHGDHEHELGHGSGLLVAVLAAIWIVVGGIHFASLTPNRKRVERRSCRPPPS